MAENGVFVLEREVKVESWEVKIYWKAILV